MKKNLSIVAIIITIIGIIVVAVKGYNVDLRYRAHQSISASIGTEFNVEDIKAITNDVFGKQEVKIEKAGIYEDEAYITVKEVSDEQLNNLKNKLNEKYNIKQNIKIPMGEAKYSVDDVKAIANEVFGKEDTNVEKYKEDETYVSIESSLISKSELENLNNKINEKYSLSNTITSIGVTELIVKNDVPRVRLTDMAKQYVLFIAIATVIIIAYFVIRFRKLGIGKVLKYTLMLLIISEVVYMSIIAITRYPINKLSMIAAFAIYVIVLTYINQKFSEDLIKKEKNN